MTKNEKKAIIWIENIRNDAVVTLDYIKKEEPNVNPIVYAGRKEKASTILKMIEELQQHRKIGTVKECQAAVEKQRKKKPIEYEDKYYACPNCKNPLMHKWEKYPYRLNNNKNGLPYCLGCGQRLEWLHEK